MATTPVAPVSRRQREAVPTESPLEAGDIACGACGKIMSREVKMGPRSVEQVEYTCINEETGCKYRLTRKVPVQMYQTAGIRDGV